MTLKSLLTTMAIVGTGIPALAFPEITVYPTPGTYDSVLSLVNINVNSTEPLTVVETAAEKPYFKNADNGDVINCSRFFYFEVEPGEGATIINFNDEDFTENGVWNLVLPAGCLKDSEGALNETLSFSYDLQDRNIGLGDFPQITLLSSNPADGAAVSYWGDTLGKVTLQTSDDDAVNYIGWVLYDITNGTGPDEKIWLRQGNDNRFDFNRYEHNYDIWVDGLFIAVGGSDMKMLAGHTYRLELKFCGIGYNPATNQYPSQLQLEKSLELETYLDFKGDIPESAYSLWEVANVMPDPETYEFTSLDNRTFTVYYTGYVKPVLFEYPLGMGEGTASAGTFSPASDPNMNGYAESWNFTFDKSVLQDSTGELMVTIEAKDEEGFYVRGNEGMEMDDYRYCIYWKTNVVTNGVSYDLLPVYVSVEDGAKIEDSLSEIVVDFGTVTYNSMSNPKPGNLFREVKTEEGEKKWELVEAVLPVEDDFFTPQVFTYTFSEDVNVVGNYKFVIEEGSFFDDTYLETDGARGVANPELVYNFSIEIESGIYEVVNDTDLTVYDIAGHAVLRNAGTGDVRSLAPGIYIVNGKKYVVR